MNNSSPAALFVALIKLLLIAVIIGEACFAILFLVFGFYGKTIIMFICAAIIVLFIFHAFRTYIGKVSRINDDNSTLAASSSIAIIALELCVLYLMYYLMYYEFAQIKEFLLSYAPIFLLFTGMICFAIHAYLAKKDKASPLFAVAIMLVIAFSILYIINFTSSFTDSSNYYSNILENAPVIIEDGEEVLLIEETEHFKHTVTKESIQKDYNNFKLSLVFAIIEIMLILPFIGVLIDFFVLTKKRILTYVCLIVSFASYVLYLTVRIISTLSFALVEDNTFLVNVFEELVNISSPEYVFATSICALCIAIWLYTEGTEKNAIENRLVKLKLSFARGEVDESEYNEKKVKLLKKL